MWWNKKDRTTFKTQVISSTEWQVKCNICKCLMLKADAEKIVLELKDLWHNSTSTNIYYCLRCRPAYGKIVKHTWYSVPPRYYRWIKPTEGSWSECNIDGINLLPQVREEPCKCVHKRGCDSYECEE
jgi:hypothetical protein